MVHYHFYADLDHALDFGIPGRFVLVGIGSFRYQVDTDSVEAGDSGAARTGACTKVVFTIV